MSGNKWIGNIKIDITEISRYMEEKGLIDRFFDWLNRKEIQKQNYQKVKLYNLNLTKSWVNSLSNYTVIINTLGIVL